MRIKLVFTIIVSKLIIKACRLAKLGGTSLPGEIARKLYPDIVREITNGFNTIMVTGTNGKTTTTKIIAKILEENGIKYITNKSGANLVDGVTTTFIDAVGLNGKSKIKTALIEMDEAAFDKMTNYLEPDVLVVTNFFRDQLDRYGELYTTLKRVKSGIAKSPKTKLVLNADDSLCASLGRDTGHEAIFYGMSSNAYQSLEVTANSDATFCLYCKTKYQYSYHVYSHLGGFRCPVCGYERPSTQVTCTSINELTSQSSMIQFILGEAVEAADCREEKSISAKINLPGLYNIYNALAAIACGHMLKLPVDNSVKALGSFKSGFGRMETINAGEDKSIKLILVKNPTGFNQVLNYLLTEDRSFQIAFLINDKIADGRDISWLWDVEFEKLQNLQNRIENIYASGLRAEDMAVRLKYAGVYTDKISIIKDYRELVTAGLARTEKGHSFYILPTYTAMLEIRKVLKKNFGLKDFWK